MSLHQIHPLFPCSFYSRPYKVRSAYPERTYYSNDLSSTLAALRLVGRASLQLDPLLPRPTVAAAPSASAAAAPAAAAKTEPALFTLQVCLRRVCLCMRC